MNVLHKHTSFVSIRKKIIQEHKTFPRKKGNKNNYKIGRESKKEQKYSKEKIKDMKNINYIEKKYIFAMSR